MVVMTLILVFWVYSFFFGFVSVNMEKVLSRFEASGFWAEANSASQSSASRYSLRSVHCLRELFKLASSCISSNDPTWMFTFWPTSHHLLLQLNPNSRIHLLWTNLQSQSPHLSSRSPSNLPGLPSISPLTTNIINFSLTTFTVPSTLKVIALTSCWEKSVLIQLTLIE